MYGASVTLGVGGSTLLVTVLTMLADLIGDNVVRILGFESCFVLLLTFTFLRGHKKAGFRIFFANGDRKNSGQVNLNLNSTQLQPRHQGLSSLVLLASCLWRKETLGAKFTQINYCSTQT